MKITYTSNLNSAKKWVEELTRQRMEMATKHLETKVRKKLSKFNGSGRIYTINGRIHQASAPY